MTAADYVRQSERLEPSHIGPRHRAERERQGLSLREIAKRVGVCASLVSQIERDKVAPSVSTLWALVRELDLSMGDLFDNEDAPTRESTVSLHPAWVQSGHRRDASFTSRTDYVGAAYGGKSA